MCFLCVKVRCHTRFQRAFTACCCVFKEITMVGSNQSNYFENSKRTLKTRVATRLKLQSSFLDISDPQMYIDTYSLYKNSSLMPVAWNDFGMQQKHFDKKYLFIEKSFYLNIYVKIAKYDVSLKCFYYIFFSTRAKQILAQECT